jgi:hypothetical protein
MTMCDGFWSSTRSGRIGLWLLVVAGLLLATPAVGQVDGRPLDPVADADDWLLPKRWGEVRYGLTIREPIDSLRLLQPRDGSLVRWIVPGEISVSLEVHQGLMADRTMTHKIEHGDGVAGAAGGGAQEALQPLRLDALVRDLTAAIETAGAREVVNTGLHDWVEVGDYIGYINYFVIHPRGDDTRPWLHGVALLKIDDLNIIVMRLECQPQATELGIHTFETMLHSIELEPAHEVLDRLRGWMHNGEDFLNATTQDDRLSAMQPDQLFRVREMVPGDGGRIDEIDIGYTRIWQRYQDSDYYRRTLAQLREDDPEAKLEGIDSFRVHGNALVMQTFLRAQGSEISRLQETVESVEGGGISEVWNLKTELRQPGDQRFGRDEGVWVETGIRDDIRLSEATVINRIEVIREGTPPRQITDYVLARERDPDRRLRFPSARPDAAPAGNLDSLQWQTPERAYLSQVDAMLVPALLPADETQTYGFFVYHAETSSLAIRLMRVEPQPDGGKVVFIRPTIDMAEQAMVFNAQGELVSWFFPDGRSMIRTTREELARIWRVRLPRD